MNKIHSNIIQSLKVVAFGIVFLTMYLFLTYLMKPLNYEIKNVAGFYGEKENTLDMVYMGGSAGFVYWEPLKAWEDKGITSYNFAADTIQAELYKYLTKETLKHQDPKVLVIDARAFQYRDKDQPPTEKSYRNILTGTPISWNRYQFIEDNVPKYLKENTLSYHFDLIKYHGNKENKSISTSLQIMMGKYQNELKGFYFVPKVDKMVRNQFNTTTETPISKETTDILNDLLAYLKTTDKKVLFVVSPYTETKAHKENFNYIERIITKANFDFLDANEYYDNMKLDFNKDFYNVNHVNIYGAEKYTIFLENYLLNKYHLPDRRLSNQYAKDWNALLPGWRRQVLETKVQINELIESR